MQFRSPLRRIVLPLAAAGLLLAGCRTTASGGGGAAVTFGDRSVSVAQFQRQLKVLKDNQFLGPTVVDQDGELDPAAVADQAASALIDLIISQRIADENLTVTPEARAEARAEVLENYDRQSNGQGVAVLASLPVWYQNQLIDTTARTNAVVNSFITEDPATYYARNKATFDAACPAGATLRYIPAKSADDGARIQAQLNGGASYESVLRAAVGPTADLQSFDAGCYSSGDVSNKQTDAALSALTPGQRTVVLLQNNYLVVDAQPVNAQTLAPSIARAQRADAEQELSTYLQDQVLARRPSFDPRFAVVTYTPGEDGTTVINLVPAGQSNTERIREMPPATTTPLLGNLLSPR